MFTGSGVSIKRGKDKDGSSRSKMSGIGKLVGEAEKKDIASQLRSLC